jgi:hypothetical protein
LGEGLGLHRPSPSSVHFFADPLPFIRPSAYYSSFSSRSSFTSSQSSTSTRGYGVRIGESDDSDDGYGRFRQMGVSKTNFVNFDEVKELEDKDDDDEVEEGEGEDDNDDDFMILNSFNRNREQREDVRRDDRG